MIKIYFSIPVVIFLTFTFSGKSLTANDQSITSESAVAESADNDFRIPRRENKAESTPMSFDLKETLGNSGIKILIGIGIFLIIAISLSKRKATSRIPIEAIEILGTIPLSGRQNIQLIRFGQKLVLIEMSANGLKPISEITDPIEVNRMLDLIRPRT